MHTSVDGSVEMEMMEPTQTGEVRQDERWWAAGAHAGALLLA